MNNNCSSIVGGGGFFFFVTLLAYRHTEKYMQIYSTVRFHKLEHASTQKWNFTSTPEAYLCSLLVSSYLSPCPISNNF